MHLVRRFRLVGPLLLSLLSLLVVSAPPVGATTLYADAAGRFAIAVPDGWVRERPEDARVVALWGIDGDTALFNIVHSTVPAGTTSLDFAKAASGGFADDEPDYYLLRKDFVACADQQCPLIDFTATGDDGGTQRIQQVYVTKGRDAWILTYRAGADDAATYAADVEAMVASFTI